MKSSAFTLMELMVVVIIIGTLSTLAYPLYYKTVESSRMSEAKVILGQIREAEENYYLQHMFYTENITQLNISVPLMPGACNSSFYFRYEVAVPFSSYDYYGVAYRCTVGGKKPDCRKRYVVTIVPDGTMSDTSYIL